MELQLKNIGIIKEANIILNGLTVIAGENDTGKSTAGRAFYYAIENYLSSKQPQSTNTTGMGTLIGFGIGLLGGPWGAVAGAALGTALDQSDKNRQLNKLSFYDKFPLKVGTDEKIAHPIMIETPYSLNNASYIKNTQLLANQKGLNFTLGDHIIDLVLQMSQTPNLEKNNFYSDIEKIIDGKVYYDEKRDDFFYYKKSIDKEFGMNSTATGIKMFGFLQILLLNGTIKEGTVLILDEPEVHLHPKWQLKYAEFIVELVKNDVKILVTSHSPYMIEALEFYSKKENIKRNFYLAQKEENYSIIKDVTKDTTLIYDLLAEPFDILEDEEMDSIKW